MHQQQPQCTVVFIHNRKGCVFGPKAPIDSMLNGIHPGMSHGQPSSAVIQGGAGGVTSMPPPKRGLVSVEEEEEGAALLRGANNNKAEEEQEEGKVSNAGRRPSSTQAGGTPDPIYGPPMKTIWQVSVQMMMIIMKGCKIHNTDY